MEKVEPILPFMELNTTEYGSKSLDFNKMQPFIEVNTTIYGGKMQSNLQIYSQFLLKNSIRMCLLVVQEHGVRI